MCHPKMVQQSHGTFAPGRFFPVPSTPKHVHFSRNQGRPRSLHLFSGRCPRAPSIIPRMLLKALDAGLSHSQAARPILVKICLVDKPCTQPLAGISCASFVEELLEGLWSEAAPAGCHPLQGSRPTALSLRLQQAAPFAVRRSLRLVHLAAAELRPAGFISGVQEILNPFAALPCGHIFCYYCLRSRTEADRRFCCPQCGTRVEAVRAALPRVPDAALKPLTWAPDRSS